MKGFSSSGFVPFNENIFREDEFMSASVTDRPLQEISISNTTNDSDEFNKDTDDHSANVDPSPKIVPSTSTSVIPKEIRPHLKAHLEKL